MALNRKVFRDNIVSYLFIAPFLLVFIIFLGYPVVYSFYISLFKTTIYSDWYNKFSTMKFVGLYNYKMVITDPDFLWSLSVSLIYAVLTIPTGIVLSLIMAVILSRKIAGVRIYRTGFFLPYVLDIFVVGVIWLFLYSPKGGVLDNLFHYIGVKVFSEKGFLGNSVTALPSIALAMVLKGMGFGMILFLSSIQNIPKSVFEAAEIDGVNPFQKVWYIIVPLVKPIILFLIITGTIAALNAFTEIYAMTINTGGPSITALGHTFRSCKLSGYYLFRTFDEAFYGKAAAISYLLLIVALILSIINIRWLTKERV